MQLKTVKGAKRDNRNPYMNVHIFHIIIKTYKIKTKTLSISFYML